MQLMPIIKFENANYLELSVIKPQRYGNKILCANFEIFSCRAILNIFYIKCKKSACIKIS